CYGTLVDWKKGVLNTLVPLFDEYLLEISEEEIFLLFKKFDSEILASDFISYRNVLKEIMKKYSSFLNINMMESDLDCLVKALPTWPVFEDTPGALRDLKKTFKLALITNSDDDLIEKTLAFLGVSFDYVITSAQVGSYKPSGNNFFRALESFDLPPHKILHVAQSIYHDIIPCNELGIQNIWVNRYDEPSPADELEKPGKEVKSLTEIARVI
ncbi:MAG: HAD-IA family hydrolase, partial [Bacteroidales bacterium]